jgi:cytochrome c oxidase subunit II
LAFTVALGANAGPLGMVVPGRLVERIGRCVDSHHCVLGRHGGAARFRLTRSRIIPAKDVGGGPMKGLATPSLEPRGPVAATIAELWWLMLGLGVVIFLVFAVLLVRGLFRRPPDGDEPGSDQPTLTRRWVLWGGAVMPAVALVVVFGATVRAMRTTPTKAGDGALEVDVVARQWQFEVGYPGEGIAKVGELHLPVGREVALRLSSVDVIHSFWIPELAGKMDMLPDRTNTLVLRADVAGRYFARCAEFCGRHHADMKMLVVVEPPEQFAAWLAARR